MLKERDSMMSPGSPCVGGVTVGGVGSTVVDRGGGGGATCAGCGGRIHDRYYLLAVDRQWHSPCLKCCECKLPLDSELTCFARDGNIYCKEDYYRMFAVKRCGRCQAGISASELVMRARDLVYHLHCFTCASCAIPLSKGDHFGMRDGLVYCRPHYELLYSGEYCDAMEIGSMFRATNSPSLQYHMSPSPASAQKGRPRKRKIPPGSDSPGSADLSVNMRMSSGTIAQGYLNGKTRFKCRSRKGLLRIENWKQKMLHPGDLSSSMESLSYDSSVASPGSGSGHNSQRTKRMRTSFKHHQLRTMKSYFAINQNPDAKDLKQLAQKTGLSKRVLQVWFQNARAKWRRNLMRQEGSQAPPGTPGQQQGGNGPPSVGSSGALLGDSNSLPHPPGLDELHHHHLHGQGSQSITFGDLY